MELNSARESDARAARAAQDGLRAAFAAGAASAAGALRPEGLYDWAAYPAREQVMHALPSRAAPSPAPAARSPPPLTPAAWEAARRTAMSNLQALAASNPQAFLREYRSRASPEGGRAALRREVDHLDERVRAERREVMRDFSDRGYGGSAGGYSNARAQPQDSFFV